MRFAVALRAGKLVQPETLEVLLSPKPEVSSPSYGYGFGVSQTPVGRVAGHSGGFSGISSDLSMHLDSGWTVAVMSNYDMGVQPVKDKIEALLPRVQ